MPAPLDVDREAVKAHALIHGVNEAARAFGLPELTVRQWSCRYKWLAPPPVVDHQLPLTIKPRVTSVTTPSEAARRQKASNSEKTKHFLGKALLRGAKTAAKLEGEEVLDRAPALKSLVDAGDKLYQWSGQPGAPVMRLELIAGSVGRAAEEELPAIDVEAEVVEREEKEKG